MVLANKTFEQNIRKPSGRSGRPNELVRLEAYAVYDETLKSPDGPLRSGVVPPRSPHFFCAAKSAPKYNVTNPSPIFKKPQISPPSSPLPMASSLNSPRPATTVIPGALAGSKVWVGESGLKLSMESSPSLAASQSPPRILENNPEAILHPRYPPTSPVGKHLLHNPPLPKPRPIRGATYTAQNTTRRPTQRSSVPQGSSGPLSRKKQGGGGAPDHPAPSAIYHLRTCTSPARSNSHPARPANFPACFPQLASYTKLPSLWRRQESHCSSTPQQQGLPRGGVVQPEIHMCDRCTHHRKHDAMHTSHLVFQGGRSMPRRMHGGSFQACTDLHHQDPNFWPVSHLYHMYQGALQADQGHPYRFTEPDTHPHDEHQSNDQNMEQSVKIGEPQDQEQQRVSEEEEEQQRQQEALVEAHFEHHSQQSFGESSLTYSGRLQESKRSPSGRPIRQTSGKKKHWLKDKIEDSSFPPWLIQADSMKWSDWPSNTHTAFRKRGPFSYTFL